MNHYKNNYLTICTGILIVTILLIGTFLPVKCYSAEYLGEQPTALGMVKIYRASEKEINKVVCERDPRFVHMDIVAFADKKRKEIWFHQWEDLWYHIDLLNDPVKWMEEARRDAEIIQENKLEKWMKEKW